MAKESSASRRARVKFQLRDKKGRWIEMGRGVKWYSPQLKRNVSGTVMGVSGRNAVVNLTSEPMGKDGKPKQVTVKGSDIEVISSKATLGGRTGKMAKVAAKTAKKAELVGGREDKGGTITAEKPTDDSVNKLIKSSEEALEKEAEKPKSKPKAGSAKAKADAKKGSQADSDKEDEEVPEIDEPDDADLEDIDLDEDLDEDEADADEDVDTSPTSVDDLEATIEELEAVVEEVASGDLDDNEIDAKLAEEVYSVYGKDGKQYDLDVKKDLEGKWNYRLRDAEGKTRKIYAMVPADENDSVDAGAKLNTAMNPKKSEAKATTAKPEEKAPEAKATPAPEAPAPAKVTISAPARRPAAKQPKLDIKGIKNVKRNGRGDYESSDMSEALMERLPVGTEISSDETKQLFIKVAPNRWAEPDGEWEARELKDVDFFGEGDDTIYLPGGDSNTTDAAEIEKLTAILDKNAENDREMKKRYEETVKAREEAKKQADPAETEAPESKTAKASKGTADMLKWRMEMRPEDKRGMEIDADNNVTVTDPAKAEQIFNETLGDTQGVSNRSDITGRQDVETQDELLSLREELDVPDTRKGAARFTPARREEPKEAPDPVDPKDMTRDELINEASDLEGLKHEADITGMGDRQFTPKHQARLDTLNKELKTRKDTPAPTKAKKDRDRRNLDIDLGTHKQENTSGLKKQHFDTGEPGGAEMWVDSEGDIVVSDTRELEALGDGTDDDLLVSYDESRQTGDVRFPDGSRKHWRMTTDAEEEGIKPKAVPETPQDAPEAAEAPTTPESDSNAPAATEVSPGRMTRDELLKEVTDLEIKGAKAAGPEGSYKLSPAENARRDALRKELDTREGEAPTEVAREVESDEGAAALASVGVERTEPRALPGEKFAPTRQQQDVIDAVMAGKDTVVQAKAGAGKTTTLQAIATRVAEASPDKKIVYVAFNSSVQKEAEARMPGNVEARTGHSIGFNWVGKAVNDRYKGENGHERLELDEDVAKHIGITGTYKGDPGSDDSILYPEDIAAAAMLTVDKFAYNAEDDINEDHLPDSMFGTSREAKGAVIDAANKIWADVNAPDGKIKLTQDHMRKMWALSRPDFGQTGAGLRRKADMLFIDEAQDTPPVLAKVIADQKMQKIIVGDADQAIYAFSGATDFLSKAEKDIELPLNRSWRFGAPVADAGNRFLELLGSKGRVVGGGNSKISEGKMQDADAVLVRTNAGALGEMVEEGSRGRIVGVEKKTIDKFKSAADTMDWLKSKNKGQTPIPKPQKVLPELAAYKDWNHVERENEKGDKPNLAMYVRLDGLYGSNGIRDALKNVVAVDSKSPGKSSAGIGGNLNGVVMDDNGKTTVAGGSSAATYLNKDDLKEAGFKYRNDPSGELMRSGKRKGEPKMSWQALGTPEQRAATVKKFADRVGAGYNPDEPDAGPVKPDVIISTAHKAKGLEWKKVRIGGDFPQPKLNKATGKMVMPDPENLRLAYVAVTRAEAELDPGSLGYVYEHTEENGGTPEPADKPVEQNEVTEPPISAADDSDFVPESDDRVADTEVEAAPEAPQAPEAEEVADESVPEAAPEAPEAAPEPVDAPEPTPAPAVAPEPVEAPEESAPEATTPDDAAPVDGLDDDGLTPAEAAYAEKLQKAISDGYRTGIGNIQALQERLDEIYDRGAARQRGEDPDAVPEAAPEVKPAVDEEPATPEAEEEVVPEADEVVEEAPEPTPETPVEAEAEPVEVVEEPTEEGPQGDASDGEEEVEAPTDLDSFEATASELFATFQDVQKTPRTPQELQDILEAEIYLLRGEDGNGYEFGLDVDDKGTWSYLLADEEGNELERYNVMTVSPEEAGQKAFERVNGSQESETADGAETEVEAPADEVITAPEAEEEVVADADRVELDPADVVVDTETVPEPAPMPVVEDTTAPEEQAPVETPEVETPEVSEEGTAPAEPESAPVSAVVAKAGNYPDGTQIKDSRTSEVIQKTNGKWHVAGKPSKPADPAAVNTPVVSEMPKQPAESFAPFDGIESVTAGDIVITKNGAQAAVIGVRDGKLVVMPHNVPNDQKALRPNTVFADPAAVTGINKFDVPDANAPVPAPAVSKPRESAYSGNRGRADLTIMDGNGYETKIGDTVMTAVGQGEVVSVRPSSGPQGSVQVRLANGDVKMFRSNKFTNAAGAESLVGDDPATMEVGAQGTGADGRKFLVGKGNKPIHKGDRVELADGRVGTVSGIYAGVKSANIKMEDGSTLRKKVSTLDALDYGMDTPETLETKNGVGLTGKVNLSNAINAARNKVALLNLTSAEKKEFEENMMKKAAELGSIKDDGSDRKGSEELFEKWVFDAIAELERKNDPLVAAGTPEAPSPLFFTVDDKGNVLELIKDEDDSLSIRLDGEWVDISDEDEFPTVYEQILKPATDDSVGAWDADLEDNQELKLEDIADYIVE